jgi:hypothetical protein
MFAFEKSTVMPRLLLCLSISLLFTFLALLIAPASGRPTPPVPLQPLITDCENIDRPCLYGVSINPITGYIETLEPKLFARGYELIEQDTTGSSVSGGGSEELYSSYVSPDDSDLCDMVVYYSSGDGHLTWIDLTDCGEFHVEDVIMHFGIPSFVTMRPSGGSLGYARVGIQVFFASRLAPDSLINRIVISPPWEGGPYLDWHGYAAFWVYCLYEPYYEVCWE